MTSWIRRSYVPQPSGSRASGGQSRGAGRGLAPAAVEPAEPALARVRGSAQRPGLAGRGRGRGRGRGGRGRGAPASAALSGAAAVLAEAGAVADGEDGEDGANAGEASEKSASSSSGTSDSSSCDSCGSRGSPSC